MKKVRADKVRGYRVDFSCDTVYLNYTFASAAERDFLSDEAKRLRQIRKAFPSFKFVVKAGRNITTTRRTKRLTYKNMEEYISTFDNADELLAEFEITKKQSKTSPSPYKFVRDWFEDKFPSYKVASIFAEKDIAKLPPSDDQKIPA